MENIKHLDFHEVISEIKNTKDKNKIEKLIDKALLATSDEKVIYGGYENAISYVKEVENIISKHKLKRPDFLDYIIASINMEYLSKKEPDKFYKAEKIYKDLIGRENSSSELKNLAKYALCIFYTRNINAYEEISNQEKEYIENFKKYFLELKALRASGKLDRHISRDFYQLEDLYNKFNVEDEKYITEGINVNANHQYSDINKAVEELRRTADILIDLENLKAYVKNEDLNLTAANIIYLYLLAKGTTNKEVKAIIGFSDDGVYQRIKIIKDKLKEYNINIQENAAINTKTSREKKYILASDVSVKVIFKYGMEIEDYIDKYIKHKTQN